MSPPKPGPRELEVPASAAGMRLDRFLAEPLGSRAQAQNLIEAGRVQVDGLRRAKRHAVMPGERVEIWEREGPVPRDGEHGAAAPFTVVMEDEHLIVVDKPAGVVVHPARGHRSGTLAQALAGRAAGGEEPRRAGIVHRLDRETSGLLVVAKSDEVHRALKAMLVQRRLHRQYLALADGIPEARRGTIEAPIGRHPRERTLMSIEAQDAREARTHFEIVRVLKRETLLSVVLDTGRTHQIRVHMAAIGHPLCGDAQYGGPMRHGLTRQFLHAGRLDFTHPVTGEDLNLRAPLPEDLALALKAASGGG
ncbi:MAG: RluA family pseudouridine synthase [Actinomycetota bacterium]|nr:RluA family pseudouridine synthase [Actinomycetota bacterium]